MATINEARLFFEEEVIILDSFIKMGFKDRRKKLECYRIAFHALNFVKDTIDIYNRHEFPEYVESDLYDLLNKYGYIGEEADDEDNT